MSRFIPLLLLCVTFCQAEEWAPDYLIIGAQKGGTTVLHDCIQQHPQVVKKPGEVHFFDVSFAKGPQWYKERFPPRPQPDHLIGDKSPYYLFHPLVPERVHSLYPHVKILIVLRNPVDRAYSHFWMNKRKEGKEPLETFEEAIEAEQMRLAGSEAKIKKHPNFNSKEHRVYSYLARGKYVKQIKRWMEYFPRKQILVISSTDLRNQPAKTMKKVYTFLGLAPFVPRVRVTHSNYPPMNPETRTRLSNSYRPYNEELEKLLGRQFSW